MRKRFLLLLVLALAVLLTLSSLAAAGQLTTTPMPSTTTPGTPTAAATPTFDRLAAPPTVYPPTQADDGAQLFWLYCQPCHGDVGQGLTDEWRAEYPEDHQNCWLSNCHGKSPYPEGFTLPTAVPPVTGSDSLGRFVTMAQVYQYIRATMPYEYPGRLTDEEYLAITAFLARVHGVWDKATLTAADLERVRLPHAPVLDQGERLQPSTDQQTPETTPVPSNSVPQSNSTSLIGGIVIAVILATGGIWLWRRHHS